MSYIDGFVIPVLHDRKDAYRAHAERTAPVFMEYGAERVVECWGDDIPDGKVTDFRRSVQANDGENVVFGWVVWPSKQVRDEAMPRLMSDERMKADEMPFDGKRMIFGGFEVLLETE